MKRKTKAMKRNVDGLEQRVSGGNFVDKYGKVLGQHKGYPFYTIGQRKGLDITFGKPVFVTKIDPETNTVVLGDETDLEQNEMMVGKLNFIKYDTITPGMEAVTKIRYKDKGSLSNIYPENGKMRVRFYENAKGIAPGQSAVFYEEDDVIGGGIIQSGQSLLVDFQQ
jgi:tRNA-specific 2-thiouridylase